MQDYTKCPNKSDRVLYRVSHKMETTLSSYNSALKIYMTIDYLSLSIDKILTYILTL